MATFLRAFVVRPAVLFAVLIGCEGSTGGGGGQGAGGDAGDGGQTTQGGGGTTSDGGSTGDAGGPVGGGGAAPEGTPIFVAVGYGGRRMSSLDGVTWDNDIIVDPNGGDDNNLF